MDKIIIGNIELDIEKYQRNFIRSEFTNNRLVRIKCETIVKGKGNNDRLKGVLSEKSFEVNIPHEKLEFKGREGEISYNYTFGNVYKDKDVEFVHVLEIIEYEEVPEELLNKVEPQDNELTLLKKRVSLLEKLLITKGLIDKDDLPSQL